MSDIHAEYQDRIVAFIDILGFEALISTIKSDTTVFRRLYTALHRIKMVENLVKSEWLSIQGLEVSAFSDSIVISGEPTRLNDIVTAVLLLQADLLFEGILTRGGIAEGPTYHADGILIGQGMIDAYHIEKSAAVYPRVVIDPVLVQRLSETSKINVDKDSGDGLWFIYPFKYEAYAPNAEELAAEGYHPRTEYLRVVALHIRKSMREAKRVDHFSKWQWMAVRYNLAIQNSKLPNSSCTPIVFPE